MSDRTEAPIKEVTDKAKTGDLKMLDYMYELHNISYVGTVTRIFKNI